MSPSQGAGQRNPTASYRRVSSCEICGRQIDASDVERRDTGDFHAACLKGLGTAGIGLKNATDGDRECSLCSRGIGKGTPIVDLLGFGRVAHLRCFFGPTNGHTRSVGACAGRLSTVDRGRVLRERSDALLALSRRLLS